jgi:hypothetical protein
MFQSLLPRGCFDQILSQLSQDYLITEQLGWLIVDHENIDLFICSHRARASIRICKTL